MAQAYLDPGTGSLLLQGLAAAFFSSLFFIKKYWRKIINFFKKSRENDETK
jgi:hypothetical protein